MISPSDERVAQVRSLATELGWRTDHFEIAGLLRALLKSLIDDGTGMDSGGGADAADLWFTVCGVEYFLTVRRSNAQLLKDAQVSQNGPG